jgi:hypothetical protein
MTELPIVAANYRKWLVEVNAGLRVTPDRHLALQADGFSYNGAGLPHLDLHLQGRTKASSPPLEAR